MALSKIERVTHQHDGDKLYAYASDKDAAHRPAWAKFNRSAGRARGAAGVWHETFLVDKAESIYVGTPGMGLARFTEASRANSTSPVPLCR